MKCTENWSRIWDGEKYKEEQLEKVGQIKVNIFTGKIQRQNTIEQWADKQWKTGM
jgi:hypothetical protein